MADLVMERYERNRKSTMLRFHTQTAGVTLTAQQPLNNAVRVSYQALSAVLGGTQVSTLIPMMKRLDCLPRNLPC